MCMDARRSTSPWIRSLLLLEAVVRRAVAEAADEVVQVHRAAVEVDEAVRARLQLRVQAQLQLPLLLLFQLPVRPLLADAAVDKRVVAVVVARVAVEAEVVQALADRPLLVIARDPQFPAWRSSMPC